MSTPAPIPLQIDGLAIRPSTPVLGRRALLPGTDTIRLPVFGDDSWNLAAAVTDRHSAGQSIHWDIYPQPLREACKLYVFALLNIIDDAPRLLQARSDVPGIKTIWAELVYLRAFLRWLDDRGVRALAQVTDDDLDDYLVHVQDADGRTTSWKRKALVAVQRLQAYRDALPEQCRLPARPLGGGATAASLVGDPGPRLGVNSTARITSDVMEVLLSAALLVSSLIADDLRPTASRVLAMRLIADGIADRQRRLPLRQVNQRAGHRNRISREQLDRLIPALMEQHVILPGVLENGSLVPDAVGLGLAGWIDQEILRQPGARRKLAATGLPVQRDWFRVTRFSRMNDGPWHTAPMDATETATVIRHVITACFLVITYLSGVRTGEALNLRRGCISHDAKLDLIFMSGQQMKATPDRAERSQSAIPWVVIAPVADAVTVLEGLAAGDLLFPAGRFCSRDWFSKASERARTPGTINSDIRRFISWFNSDIAPATEHPPIPDDPDGIAMDATRLRRTLAWHIVRRPGGTIAGAIQYGHLRTQITQGYAGHADSGFADEVAFEELLLRVETIHDDAHRLADGERVSGPAATDYRERVGDGAQFAGMTITTKAHARAIMANPALSIHHGDLLTCVYRAETAACQRGGEGPVWTKCSPACRNIARTDRDVETVRKRVLALEADLAGPALPLPIRERTQQRIVQLRQVLEDHQHEAADRKASGPCKAESDA